MKKYTKLTLVLMLSVMMLFAAACGNNTSNSDNASQVSGKITVGGSSALEPLAAAAAEQFMGDNPDAEIQVEGGGSGTGLSEVSKGNYDIGDSDVFAEEKSGIPAEKLVDHKVAVVGMTAAVNPGAGVTNLSKADLIKVFTGKVTNWKEVGGNDVKITLVNRPDGSGTRATFIKYALDGATPAEGITEDSSNRVKQIIADTPGTIGYEAFSYFTDNSIVRLSVDGVEATDENVQSGKFTIWAYEHMYTNGEATGLAKAFIDYMMSDEVQNSLIPTQGYISSSKMQVVRNAKGETTKK